MDMPQDPFMKSQYVNMMLKANNMDLNTYCVATGTDPIALEAELGRSGIKYDTEQRQFKT